MERSHLTCEACKYNAPLKAYEVPPATGIDGKHTNFCLLCASTRAGIAYWHEHARGNCDVLYTICFVGNAILDALGLLWPTEDVTAPTGTGPGVIEVERDALNIRLIDLEKERASLDNQADEAIRQRDEAIEALAASKTEHTLAIGQAKDRIAKAEAQLAVLDVSIPEDTTDPEDVEDPLPKPNPKYSITIPQG